MVFHLSRYSGLLFRRLTFCWSEVTKQRRLSLEWTLVIYHSQIGAWFIFNLFDHHPCTERNRIKRVIVMAKTVYFRDYPGLDPGRHHVPG